MKVYIVLNRDMWTPDKVFTDRTKAEEYLKDTVNAIFDLANVPECERLTYSKNGKDIDEIYSASGAINWTIVERIVE